MGGELVKAQPSYREIFYQCFPLYLSMGMSAEEYWDDDPWLAYYYRKAYRLKLSEKSQEAWLQGIYFSKAIEATIGNMFAKKGSQKLSYPSEPFAFTKEDAERQEKRKQQNAKARLAAWAQSFNSKMPLEVRMEGINEPRNNNRTN